MVDGIAKSGAIRYLPLEVAQRSESCRVCRQSVRFNSASDNE